MILNVEDVAADGQISSKTEFDSAYATYDDILREAVAQKLTIIAVHYDANILRDEDDPTKVTYTGGAQIILDKRAVSDSTLALANRLIRDDKLLQQLNDTGLRVRPDYDDEIRYQSNLTLNIIGHSDGAGLLLEIGPQEQAIELFGTPEAIVSAIEKPLQTLASAVKSHREMMR